jgi:hypothetical protein
VKNDKIGRSTKKIERKFGSKINLINGENGTN